uniref:DUF4461 domain-containing protein n=1 Tax=Macrostomum lignano TaxID=282301 RepID=A0A1I8HSK4_9PLAT
SKNLQILARSISAASALCCPRAFTRCINTRVLYDHYARDFSPTLAPDYPPEALLADPEALAGSIDARGGCGGDRAGWATVRAAAEALAAARNAAGRLREPGRRLEGSEAKLLKDEYRRLHDAFWDRALGLPNRLHPDSAAAPDFSVDMAAEETPSPPGLRRLRLAGRQLEFVEPAGLRLQSRAMDAAASLTAEAVNSAGHGWLLTRGPDWVTAPVLAACGWSEADAIDLPADKRDSADSADNPHLRLFLVGAASLPAMAAQLGRRQAATASLPIRLACRGRLHAPGRQSAEALSLLHGSVSAAACDAAFAETVELASAVWRRLANELPLPGRQRRIVARTVPPERLRLGESRRIDWTLESRDSDSLAPVPRGQLDEFVGRRLMCLNPRGQPLSLVHTCLLDCGSLLRTVWPE